MNMNVSIFKYHFKSLPSRFEVFIVEVFTSLLRFIPRYCIIFDAIDYAIINESVTHDLFLVVFIVTI